MRLVATLWRLVQARDLASGASEDGDVEVFGAEMTAATGVCASCGARRQIAELMVYVRTPGTVARCPTCEAVVIVLTDRGINCVDLRGLEVLETRGARID